MIEEIKEPVIDEITENVEEQATEELVDGTKESEEERINRLVNEKVDELLPKKLARKEAKIRKEYDKKYGRLENVLKAGTGEEDLETMTDTFADFYTKKGVQIPSTPHYSQREMEILANAEAEDIISAGYDEIKEEVDRLAAIGVENMSVQDKFLFTKLAAERSRIEESKELASIGVTEVDDDFREFAKKLNPNLSMKEKYGLYTQLNSKAKGTKIGSMKTNTIQDNGVKEFYTYDEAMKFTKEDYDKNPELFKAVENSMTRW